MGDAYVVEVAAGGKEGSGLLGRIPVDEQLTLRFDGISAFVSTSYEKPSIVQQARRALSRKARATAEQQEQRQVRAHGLDDAP
jgi:hypothetical protein